MLTHTLGDGIAPMLAHTLESHKVDLSAVYDVAIVTRDVSVQDVVFYVVDGVAKVNVVKVTASGSRRYKYSTYVHHYSNRGYSVIVSSCALTVKRCKLCNCSTSTPTPDQT